MAALYTAVSTAEPLVHDGFGFETLASGLIDSPFGIGVAPPSFRLYGGHVFIGHRSTFNRTNDNYYISRIAPDVSVTVFLLVGPTDPGAIAFGRGDFGENLLLATNTTDPGIGNSKVLEVDSGGGAIAFSVTGGVGSGGIGVDQIGSYNHIMYIGYTGLDGIGEVTTQGDFLLPVLSNFSGPNFSGPTGIQFC